MQVTIKKQAMNAILDIGNYVELELKMPQTATAYSERLILFGFALGQHPRAYPLCRNLKLAKQNLHCATFDKKWVFVYKIGSRNVIIHQISWGGLLK